jgi:hypothetical protein
VEFIEVSEGPDEYLLGHVLRFGRLEPSLKRQGKDGPPVSLDQILEGLAIAGQRLLHQFGVVQCHESLPTCKRVVVEDRLAVDRILTPAGRSLIKPDR